MGRTSISKDMLAIPDEPAATVLNDLVGIEEELTLVEHARVAAKGFISESALRNLAPHTRQTSLS